jgi:hypothetical protein
MASQVLGAIALTDEEIDDFYGQVAALKLRRTAVPTVWVMPDQHTFRNVPDRPALRRLTKEMGQETLEILRKSLELSE